MSDVPDLAWASGVIGGILTVSVAVIGFMARRAISQMDKVLHEHTEAVKSLNEDISELRLGIENVKLDFTQKELAQEQSGRFLRVDTYRSDMSKLDKDFASIQTQVASLTQRVMRCPKVEQ